MVELLHFLWQVEILKGLTGHMVLRGFMDDGALYMYGCSAMVRPAPLILMLLLWMILLLLRRVFLIILLHVHNDNWLIEHGAVHRLLIVIVEVPLAFREGSLAYIHDQRGFIREDHHLL
jgi:hypothetical protein